MESGPIPDVKLVAGAGFEPGAIDRATEETASNMLPVNAEKCPTVVTHCHAHSATKRAPRTARLAGKVGSVVVPIYPLSYIRKNGSEVQQYCVSYYEAGRRVRRNFASIDEAKAFAEKQARAIDRGEREAARFTGDDARTLATAKTLVRETGLSIVEVCRQFVADRKSTRLNSSHRH